MQDILRCFDVGPDMGHRETVVHLAGAGRAFDEVLVGAVEPELPPAVNANEPAGTRLLSCLRCFFCFWFGHRNSPER